MIILLIYAQKNKARIENQLLRDSMDPFLIPTERLVFFCFSRAALILALSRFMERYRMPPHLAQKLIGEISPYVDDDNEQRIPLHLRVLSTLNFYAGGCYQRRVGMDAFGMMSQTMVSKCVSEISEVITNHLGHIYIRFPQTQQEVDTIKERFLEDYDLPGVLALVDGTQIRVAGINLDKKVHTLIVDVCQ